MEPAQLIRSVRQRAGLTQAELARRAGTSQPVISAYEHGRRDPTSATLRRLVEAAGQRLRIEAAPARASTIDPPGDLGEHGRRLVDVLSLADAIPARRRTATLAAPRMISRTVPRTVPQTVHR
jgi:transcriptional regulator with XRE-family HTH domain